MFFSFGKKTRNRYRPKSHVNYKISLSSARYPIYVHDHVLSTLYWLSARA
jgi:hypothetical protein